MNKKLLEIHFDEKINENSIIVYKNGKWIATDKHAFLDYLNKNVENLFSRIELEEHERTRDVEEILSAINEIKQDIAYLKGEDTNEE